MNPETGGLSSAERQRQTAAAIARKKVLAAYSSHAAPSRHLPVTAKEILVKDRPHPTTAHPAATPDPTTTTIPSTAPHSSVAQTTSDTAPTTTPAPHQPAPEQAPVLKDAPINTTKVSAEWQKYHSAWQNYYQNYYNNYYSKAAENYLATAKMKDERIATGQARKRRTLRRLLPVFIIGFIVLVALFLQYNRLIFAPIMAYIVPDTGSVTTSLEAVDPTINQAVSPDPRLIIPKLNVDVPVAFNISTDEVMSAMNYGVAQFSIPGANALPGQIGNLVITGHSAGDIYSSNPYKFIFSGLERLEPGDLIYINYESTRYTYQLTKKEVVEPTNVKALIYDTDKPMLTLITCTPLGTSRYRLLVTAEQISPDPSPDNVAAPTTEATDSGTTMPANEPSFFESIWQGIFGSD